MSSQRIGSMDSAQDNIRKRVCKACDRCRLKKSKCDGASPCSRCKADNAICVFGERKKSQDKVYPKGYVEMLEQQQSQLVAGLRELYSRLQKGQGWPGQPLREAQGGHPLTHDILERLDLLHPTSDNSNNFEAFEEDCGRMQQKLLDQGATLSHRRGSVSSDSDHGHNSSPSSSTSTPPTQSMSFNEPFSRNQAPPTPPMNSPFTPQSQMAPPVKTETPIASPTFMSTGAFDPPTLSQTWQADSMMTMDDVAMDFKYMHTLDPFNNNFDSGPMMMGSCASTIDPPMPMIADFDLDFFSTNVVAS